MMTLTKEEQLLNKNAKDQCLHHKYDTQLVYMDESHVDKTLRLQKELDKYIKYPDLILAETENEFSEYLKDKPEEEKDKFIKEHADIRLTNLENKIEKLYYVCEAINGEIILRADKKVIRNPVGTTYYIDFTNGNDTYTGLAAVYDEINGPWATLTKFMANARSAGDKAIIRRGMGEDTAAAIAVTSDGTIIAPIVVQADIDDIWGDDAAVSETATFVYGSKTVTFADDVSGEISAGDWIYNSSDDSPADWAYEVASVDTNIITLFLPFKGTPGASKAVVVMPYAPNWNVNDEGHNIVHNDDNCWKYLGMRLNTTATKVVDFDTTHGIYFKDCILHQHIVGGSAYNLLNAQDDTVTAIFEKCRTMGGYYLINGLDGAGWWNIKFKDCYFDGESQTYATAMNMANGSFGEMIECEWVNWYVDIRNCGSNFHQVSRAYARNCVFSGSQAASLHQFNLFGLTKIDDFDNVPNDTKVFNAFHINDDVAIIQSETSTVRGGSSPISIKVNPGGNIGNEWEFSRVKIFEIPIYATTDSKTYSVYFNLPAAGFDVAPTAGELFIELEAWGNATNKFRKITKSTGTIAADGDWHALTVTVVPAIAGVAYLRCWYGKSKEGGNDNIFYVDPLLTVA